MRKSVSRAMFETAMLKVQAEEAMLNPQAPKPVETVLTPEQHAARRRQQIIDGYIALHERNQREAGTRRSY
jgi:hypothetical protein